MQEVLKDACRYLWTAPWTDDAFSWDKAYICSVFAKLAYCQIPKYELDDPRRYKVIPCVEYRETIRRGGSFTMETLVNVEGIEDHFVLELPYMVVVGVLTAKVIIVAIRGSKRMYDWEINFNCRRSRILCHDFPVQGYGRLHHGFMTDALESRHAILRELKKWHKQKTPPIYITGHSLGAALGAILYGLHLLPGDSCYSYAMPRYGDAWAMATLREPYPIVKLDDYVPRVPMRCMGYADCLPEYILDGLRIPGNYFSESYGFFKWITNLMMNCAIEKHDIEGYIVRTREKFKLFGPLLNP